MTHLRANNVSCDADHEATDGARDRGGGDGSCFTRPRAFGAARRGPPRRRGIPASSPPTTGAGSSPARSSPSRWPSAPIVIWQAASWRTCRCRSRAWASIWRRPSWPCRTPASPAWAALREGASPEALGRLRLGAAETEELLESRPGSVWNLSNAEMEGLRMLRPALGGPARAGLAQATTSVAVPHAAAPARRRLSRGRPRRRRALCAARRHHRSRRRAPPRRRGRPAARRRLARAARGAPQLPRPPARRAGRAASTGWSAGCRGGSRPSWSISSWRCGPS